MVDVAQLERLTTRDVLSLAVELQRGVIEREAMKLVVAADWADRHCPATVDPDLAARTAGGKVIPGSDRARLFGGDGTPEVLEFAPAELGVAYEMSRWQANRLIADALDLRHRLPRLWGRVLAGEVPAWKACKIAAATRQLSKDAAGQVDAEVCEAVSRESWTRFCDLLTGRIIAADPELAQALADQAARARFVRTGRSKGQGMTSIHAQASQGEV